MAATHATHLSANHSPFHHAPGSSSWNGTSSSRHSPSGTPTATTYLMPTSPAKNRRLNSPDGYRPKKAKTNGQKPACLVNAPLSYFGNNQNYTFGGFDQFIN